jgi:plastocyanin
MIGKWVRNPGLLFMNMKEYNMRTRKSRWLGIAIIGLILIALLAACGDNDNSNSDENEPEPTATAEQMEATTEPTATAEQMEATTEPTATTGQMEATTEPTATAEPTSETGSGTGQEMTAEVSMVDNAFEPQEITVAPGTTVIWTNNGSVAHTVVSGERDNSTDMFDSGNIDPGGTFEYTFTEEGTFPYFCNLHPGMDGTVIVSSQ